MEFKLEEPIYIDLLNSIRAQKDSQISRRNSTVEMEFQSKFVATTYDETVSEEVLFQNGDWEAACNKLDALESQGIELDAKQLALKSFCLSKTNASSTWSTYALLSIKNDPSQVLAYCAMATGALEKRNLQDAAYWLSLAHETGLSDLEPEYARSKLAYNYCEEHFNIMLSKLIPCFKAPFWPQKLRKLYPKLAESDLFSAGVEAVKANPQDFKKILASNCALSWFLSQLASDPAPEILNVVNNDSNTPKQEPHRLRAEADITNLPHAVLIRLASLLSLSTISKLRQTTPSMCSSWDHWELWRSHVSSMYLSTMRTGIRIPKIDIGCYPLAPHEWEPFARTLDYVMASWNVAKQASEGLEHGISGHSYVFSATDNDDLRKLALKHQIFAAADYEEPFNDVLLALINLLCIDKGPLIPTLINAITSTPMLMTHLAFNPRSKVASTSALVSSMLILRKPLSSLDFRKMCYLQASESLSSAGDSGALAARGAIAFADKLGHGFQLIPIWFPDSRPSSMLSKPIKITDIGHLISRSASGAESEAFQSVSSRRPQDRPVGGIHGKSDCNGVYRLFYRYNYPEIEDEYDRGYIEIKLDSETWRICGDGFDSLRGKFKLLDGNSRLTKSLRKEGLQPNNEEVNPFDERPSHAVRTLSLTLQYEDNTRIALNGSLFPYGYAGQMSFLDNKRESHGTPEPTSCFGHWFMVYDHASTSAQGEDRAEELKYLRDEAFEQFETPDKLRFGFPLIPYRRPVERFFEPWAPEVQSKGYASGILKLRNFSKLFQSTHSDSFDVRLNLSLVSMEVPLPEQVSMVLRRQTIRAAGDRETKAKYAARCLAWLTLYLEYRCCALDFAIQYAADRFDRAIQRFEFGSPQEVFDEKCFWAQLLCLCTEMTLCEPQALLLLLQDAQKIKSMRQSEREAILAAEPVSNVDTISDSVSSSDSSFFDALDKINGVKGLSTDGKEDHPRAKSKRASKRLGAVSIAAIVGSVVLVGVGAFVAFRSINRKPAKR